MYDEIRGCAQCGQDFTFTVGEQKFYAEKGLTGKPSRCGPCRGKRQTFAAACDKCGKETRLPFEPDGSRPVYCRPCFDDQRGARGVY
jgi:CxxC-x17-CxxC domain-containing protein